MLNKIARMLAGCMTATVLLTSCGSLSREVPVPVLVPAAKCKAPRWPATPDLAACPDDVCVFRSVGLWIRAAEAYHDALRTCPSVEEVNLLPFMDKGVEA